VRIVLPLAVLMLSSCADPEMEKRVADLEAKVTKLEGDLAKAPARGAPPGQQGPTGGTPEEEQAAGEIVRLANEAVDAGRYDEAKAKVAECKQKFANTKACKRLGRIESELSVIGTNAPKIEVASWYQGSSTFDEGDATLVVFWETWCPHCQREVPTLEAKYEKFKPQGLNVIALTKVTRSASDEKVNEFIKEHELSFPVGKEKDGSMSESFAVQGIPAAAVVKDGKIVWRGHPARLSDEMLQNWLM
jgi:thiol-disulfide isomerase/thioredoxin